MRVDQLILDLIECFKDIRLDNAGPALLLLRKSPWLGVSGPMNMINVDLQFTNQGCEIGRLHDHWHAQAFQRLYAKPPLFKPQA